VAGEGVRQAYFAISIHQHSIFLEALFYSERRSELTYLGYVLSFLKRRTRHPTGADVEIQFNGRLRKLPESCVQISSSHPPRVVFAAKSLENERSSKDHAKWCLGRCPFDKIDLFDVHFDSFSIKTTPQD